jgi:hypothetical protein
MRGLLIEPENDCKWGTTEVPKPRKHPIGPDVE